MSNAPNPFETELRRQLKNVYVKTFLLRLASGLVSFVATGAWVVLALVLWTVLTREPALSHTLFVVRAAVIVLAGLFVAFVIVPLFRMPRLSHLAQAVEDRKSTNDLVTAGYEFSQSHEAEERYSPTLIREVIKEAVRSITGLQVRFLFLTRRQLQFVPIAYAALIVLAIIAMASPGTLLDTIGRMTSPESASAIVHEPNLQATPGNVTVLAGSDVEVSAVDMGGSKQPVTLSYNLSEGFWKTEPTESEDAPMGDTSMEQHTYTFQNIRSSVSYYFEAGERRSPEYHIEVVHKPLVTDMRVVLTPPAYTREKPDTIVNSGGNVQALEGTDVQIVARANNPLKNAWVQFGKERLPVAVDGQNLQFGFRALEDGNYSILLEDELGHKTDEPLAYSIEVYKDNPPVLDVLEPGDDATLPRNLMIDVSFIASDDYGITRAGIYYRKNGEDKFKGSNIPLDADQGQRDVAKGFSWDLSEVTLFPGNYVEYFIQVQDNNVITGPGITRSRIYQVSVPTMAELYDQIQEDDTKRSDMLTEARKESEALKERMEKLSREFKKTEKLDWSQKKEIDKAIASQEAIQQKIDDIEQSLDETLQSLSDNEMTSQEIGEKLEEIQKLIQQINDEALNKYVDELRKAMEKLNPDEIQQALENLDLTAEDLLKSLERTQELLEEIQKEQDMEEIVRDTRDLMDKQEDIAEQTAEASQDESKADEAKADESKDAEKADGEKSGQNGEKSDAERADQQSGDKSDSQNADEQKSAEELAKEQKELAKKAEELLKKLQEMAERLKQDAEDPGQQEIADNMKEASENFQQSQTDKKMRKASEQMQQGNMDQAQQQQQEAQDQLISLFQRVMEMQTNMQAQSQNQKSENLQRLARNTLDLSFKQERLTARLREQVAGEDVSNVRALAHKQLAYATAIRQVADELHEIAKRSIEVPKSLLELVGQTMQAMNNSLLFLEQNKAFMSTASASQAVTNLNLATIELLTAAQACQQGAGSGQSSQQTRLQQMMSGQQQVNKETQEMLQMRAMQEKILQERQATMRRLAGQQRSLQDMAKEIQKDAGDERVLGRMDKIVEEMEDVIRDLADGSLDKETMRKEQQILSRLLDANRSVHTRDYEKKRTSTTARDMYSDNNTAGRNQTPSQQLREEIRRAMSLKAPGEFEDLIRLYFRALAEEAPSTGARSGGSGD